jgi:hypothetical protein
MKAPAASQAPFADPDRASTACRPALPGVLEIGSAEAPNHAASGACSAPSRISPPFTFTPRLSSPPSCRRRLTIGPSLYDCVADPRGSIHRARPQARVEGRSYRPNGSHCRSDTRCSYGLEAGTSGTGGWLARPHGRGRIPRPRRPREIESDRRSLSAPDAPRLRPHRRTRAPDPFAAAPADTLSPAAPLLGESAIYAASIARPCFETPGLTPAAAAASGSRG